MNKALIDTTVLTGTLLADPADRRRMRAAVERFDARLLPAYAIKEFRSGPLKNFVWMHNQLAETNRYSAALEALQRMSRTPKRYTVSTAIEALRQAAAQVGTLTHPQLEAKYGKHATQDATMAASYRLAIHHRIKSAWRNRSAIATETLRPLRCYDESPPVEDRGLLKLKGLDCDVGAGECSLADVLRRNPELLESMCKRIREEGPKNRENEKRASALHDIHRKPRDKISPKICQILGDAMFVLLCPSDAVILTTNLKDFTPLANAAGVKAQRPDMSPHSAHS